MRKDEYRQGALGDVDQRDRNRVFPTEDPIDVGRAEVLRAMFAQVDPPPYPAGDVARRCGAEEARGQNRQNGVQRRARLRRNLMVSGAPLSSQASLKPLCK